MNISVVRTLKQAQVLYGDAEKKQNRLLKKERKDIAQYYRLIRSEIIKGYGPIQARIAHRYAVVTAGDEARTRIKNLTE